MPYTSILKSTGPTTLTKIWYEDGTAVDAGNVAIAATDAAGATVVASTAATKTGTGANTVYSYALAIQTQVKVLFVTWTRADTGAVLSDTVEVVGGQLFSLTEARSFDEAALTSTTTYTNAEIIAERDRVTALLEMWTGRSWIPRYCRIELPGSGEAALDITEGRAQASNGRRLDRPGRFYDTSTVITANDGSSITVGNVVIDHGGYLRLSTGVWAKPTTADPFNVTVEYEYGLPYPEAGAGRIALLLVRDRLIKSDIPDAAISYQGERGAMQLVREGGPTGNLTRIPEVNAWIAANRVVAVG